MNHRIVKSISKILIFLIWVVVAFLSAECAVRIYEYIVAKTNPLILSLNDQPPWSHSNVVQENQLQSIEPLPPPDIGQWYKNRAEFFLQLDEHDKQLFSSFYQIAVLIKDLDKEEKTVYLPEPNAKHCFNDELLSALEKEIPVQRQNTYSKYYPSFTNGEEIISDLFVYYPVGTKNQSILLCWYKSKNPDNLQNTKDIADVWEIPYFEYKKHARLHSYEFHTNNFGFRDEDIVVPKPPNVFRIVCIGGSTTEEGPTESETYPNLLERFLSTQYHGGYKIEVINAGMPGISANKLWLRLPDYLLMEPNLIVYCEGANDITHILLPYWLNHLNGMKKICIQSKLFRNVFPLLFLPNDTQIQNDISKDVLSHIKKIENYLQQKGVLFAVMSMPAPNYSLMTRREKDYLQYVTRKWWGGDFINYRMYYYVLDIYNKLLKERFLDKDVLYIPMYEEYQKEPPYYFCDLCHQKMKGIQRKAEIIMPYLLAYIKRYEAGHKQ